MTNGVGVIETKGLTKYYGKTRGIENLDLEVKEGEIFGFLGPNGAGKTTTIRLLLGLIFPTRGRAFIFGQNVAGDSLSIRNEIGYVPGDVRFYSKMSGEYLLNYFSRFKPSRPPKLKAELIERFDLDLTRNVSEYSKGNKQKLAIVLALMHEPRLLILDEPTLGLDPLMQREFYQVVKEFRERGSTVFLSSHILPEVEKVCDRVGVIRDGYLAAIESVKEIATRKIHHLEVSFGEDVTAGFFDFPGITRLEKHNRTFQIVFKGELDYLIKVLSQVRVLDMNLTHASLEEVFFEFYQKGGQGES